MRKTEPTPMQARILDFLARLRGENGYSPTYQEIADHVGRTKATVHEHVQTLRRKGLMEADERYRHRGLRPTGAWLPPGQEAADERSLLQDQRNALAQACREALVAFALTADLREKLEAALQPLEVG